MPEEYEALVEALKNTGIPFAEDGWSTSPEGEYGVISLEFEAGALDGDDRKTMRAWEGSIDVFYRQKSRRAAILAAVEDVLDAICGASWHRESHQHEDATGLYHAEWVYQVEE